MPSQNCFILKIDPVAVMELVLWYKADSLPV